MACATIGCPVSFLLFFSSLPTGGSISGYCIMIGKALLRSSRTVAVHFLFDLFPVPVSGSKMSVSGYCSYFLFPPATRFWSVIPFLFYTLSTIGYTTHISYFVLSITRYHKRQKTRVMGGVPLVLGWKNICLAKSLGQCICTKMGSSGDGL